MKILTITCHDVYNAGASLQAYALIRYLDSLGHSALVIDYKPAYLSGHFKLLRVDSLRFQKNVLSRCAYILAKMPGKLLSLPKKWRFDRFKHEHLATTSKTYTTYQQLQDKPPQADLYLAGSDQIWNPLFNNGYDPAFYLDFAPIGASRASYAASFAVDALPPQHQAQVARWLSRFDFISTREQSGVAILERLGIHDARAVADPVFLLDAAFWTEFSMRSRYAKPSPQPYVLVYHFDRDPAIPAFVRRIAQERGAKVYSFFKSKGHRADRSVFFSSPEDFVALVRGADCVISNSFHATAFAIMFEKDFYVFNRKKGINTRMRDLLSRLDLSDRLVNSGQPAEYSEVHYDKPRQQLAEFIAASKAYLDEVLRMVSSSNLRTSTTAENGEG